MYNKVVHRHKQVLDNEFEIIQKVEPDAPEMRLLARYLCVAVSGFIEQSVRTLLSDFAAGTSSPPVASYVRNEMRWVTNLKATKLLDVVGEFSSEWRAELEKTIAGESADAIDSLVNNRHKIAHGESIGVSLVSVKKYYKAALVAVDAIDQKCRVT